MTQPNIPLNIAHRFLSFLTVPLLAVTLCGAMIGCSDDDKNTTRWLASKDEVKGEAVPNVRFADGSTLLATSIKRKSGTEGSTTLWWQPDAKSKAQQLHLKLWPIDGSDKIDLGQQTIAPSAGSILEWHLPISHPDMKPKLGYWVAAKLLDNKGKRIGVAPFPDHWVPLGLLPRVDAKIERHPAPSKSSVSLVAGGDANLGRRMNGIATRNGFAHALGSLNQLKNADIAFINLESVIAAGGQQGFPKGESVPHYYRGRPEQVNILTEAGIDVVGMANNHAGDYGPDALVEQTAIIAKSGILGVGAGKTKTEACAPGFVHRNGLTVAIISIDTTWKRYGATADQAGICYLDPSKPKSAIKQLKPHLQVAREGADVVLAAVHWGKNEKSRPTKQTRTMAKALIKADIDGILGSSAHILQGVELVDGRPVIYDLGNVLFDNHAPGEMKRGGLFELELDATGVRNIHLHPIDLGYGNTTPATGNSAARTLLRFRALSAELGTHVGLGKTKGTIHLPTPASRERPTELIKPPSPVVQTIAPETTPPENCVVSSVPEDAKIDPLEWGAFRLLGVRMNVDNPKKRKTMWLETWWTITEPVDDDVWMYTRMKTSPHDSKRMWWADHEHCDWMWPSSRWKPGQIIRDNYNVRPPRNAKGDTYHLTLDLIRDKKRMRPSVVVEQVRYK